MKWFVVMQRLIFAMILGLFFSFPTIVIADDRYYPEESTDRLVNDPASSRTYIYRNGRRTDYYYQNRNLGRRPLTEEGNRIYLYHDGRKTDSYIKRETNRYFQPTD